MLRIGKRKVFRSISVRISQSTLQALEVPVAVIFHRKQIIFDDKGFFIRINLRLIGIFENRFKAHAESSDGLSIVSVFCSHQHG